MPYSDQELAQIYKEIAGRGAEETVYFSGKEIRDDWDEEKFIQHYYDNEYLAACQQGYISLTTTFEDYISSSLQRLAERKQELMQEVLTGNIDQRTYQNAKMLAEMAETAFKHHLEKTERQRLLAV
jgi:hypothetical protein